MTLEQDAERGRLAQAMLDSDIYQDAVGKVRQGVMAAWAQSPLRDKEGQHELRLMLKLLDDLEGNIREVANTGKLARVEIERERGLMARVQRLAGIR